METQMTKMDHHPQMKKENCEVESTDSNDEDQECPMDREDDSQPSDVTLEDVLS